MVNEVAEGQQVAEDQRLTSGKGPWNATLFSLEQVYNNEINNSLQLHWHKQDYMSVYIY